MKPLRYLFIYSLHVNTLFLKVFSKLAEKISVNYQYCRNTLQNLEAMVRFFYSLAFFKNNFLEIMQYYIKMELRI